MTNHISEAAVAKLNAQIFANTNGYEIYLQYRFWIVNIPADISSVRITNTLPNVTCLPQTVH
jgi:hypothetical protein